MQRSAKAKLFFFIFAALAVVVLLAAFFFWEKHKRSSERLGYMNWVKAIHAKEPLGFCDEQSRKNRVYVATVLDRFDREIQDLWRKRQPVGEPAYSLLDLGKVKIRLSPQLPPVEKLETNVFSWGESFGLVQLTQLDQGSPLNEARWRDLDSMVRYLIEKDIRRIFQGAAFVPPQATRHTFAPHANVSRSGKREFSVKLDIGDFHGYEVLLANIFESAWRGEGYTVKILWVDSAPEVYSLRALLTTQRSFVNHKQKQLLIANLAWTKTLAHELGHVLGFDDHYYTVWNERNCYYSEISHLSDLMSNSERGRINKRHWELLHEAYPWQAAPKIVPFPYTFVRSDAEAPDALAK